MIYRFEPAFFGALRQSMTRPPIRQSRLQAWVRRLAWLVESVYRTAAADGMDEAARRGLVFQVDRRAVSLETILATLRYRASHEYPYLLAHLGEHSLTTFHATNLNDRYLVMKAAESITLPRLGAVLTLLRNHLDGVPER